MGKRVQLDMQSCGRTDGLFVSVMCADPGSYAIHTCNVDGGIVGTYYSEDDDTCSGESIRTAVVGASGVCHPSEGGSIMVSCDGEVASYVFYADPSCEGPSTWTHELGRCDPQCDDHDDDDECEGVCWGPHTVELHGARHGKESAAGYAKLWTH